MSSYRGAIAASLVSAALLALPAVAPGAIDRAIGPCRHVIQRGQRMAVAAPKLRGASCASCSAGVGKSGAFVLDASSDQVLFSRKGAGPHPRLEHEDLHHGDGAGAVRAPDPPRDRSLVALTTSRTGSARASTCAVAAIQPRPGMRPCQARPRVRAAGVTSVQGPLRYDDTFLDRVTTIPQHGISLEGIRTLGADDRSRPPEESGEDAAQRLRDALAKAGVSIGNSVTPAARCLPAPPAIQVAELGFRHRRADRSTNQPSDNFLAEMLLKDRGARTSDPPREGSMRIKRFAGVRDSASGGENGSGLSRRNRLHRPRWSGCCWIRCSRSISPPLDDQQKAEQEGLPRRVRRPASRLRQERHVARRTRRPRRRQLLGKTGTP